MFNVLKHTSLLVTIGLLSACGFTPMYGQHSGMQNASVKSSLDTIDIALIPNRSGQYLRNQLIDRFYISGYPNNPQYDLKLTPLKEYISDFDISVESEATRRQVKIQTSMQLLEKATNKIVLTRSLTGITSYNVLESEYSTIVTEQSARESALKDIARQVEQQIVLYLNRE